MVTVSIPASRSLTLSSKIPQGNINGPEILVGTDGACNYYSYLYFDLSTIPHDIELLSAELVLFKTADFFHSSLPKFTLRPLLKLFSSYSTYENPCPVDFNPALKQEFRPFTQNVAVEINITPLIAQWLRDTPDNRGIVIQKEKCSESFLLNLLGHTRFGSAFNKERMLVPFTRITYKYEFCVPNITYKAVQLPS